MHFNVFIDRKFPISPENLEAELAAKLRADFCKHFSIDPMACGSAGYTFKAVPATSFVNDVEHFIRITSESVEAREGRDFEAAKTAIIEKLKEILIADKLTEKKVSVFIEFQVIEDGKITFVGTDENLFLEF